MYWLQQSSRYLQPIFLQTIVRPICFVLHKNESTYLLLLFLLFGVTLTKKLYKHLLLNGVSIETQETTATFNM